MFGVSVVGTVFAGLNAYYAAALYYGWKPPQGGDMLNPSTALWVWAVIGVLLVAASWAATYRVFTAPSSQVTPQVPLFSALVDEYRDSPMLEAMRSLKEWQQKYQGGAGGAGEEFRRRLRERYDEEAKLVDHARRRVAGYFQKICVCWELHLLTEEYVRRLANRSQVEFYREVVEPLEEALNPAYDRACFEKLGALYGIGSTLPMTWTR